MVAGTPEDWVRWLTETYAPAGLNHALVSFMDPFTVRPGPGSKTASAWDEWRQRVAAPGGCRFRVDAQVSPSVRGHADD